MSPVITAEAGTASPVVVLIPPYICAKNKKLLASGFLLAPGLLLE
jgi:hypothetical protein